MQPGLAPAPCSRQTSNPRSPRDPTQTAGTLALPGRRRRRQARGREPLPRRRSLGGREAPAGEELGLGASEPAGGRLCFHSAEPPTLRHHGNRSGPVAQWGPLGTQVPGLTRPLPPLGPPLSSLGALRGQAPSRATTATNTPLSQSLSPNHLSRPSKRGRGTREELPKANSYFHPCRQPLPRPLLSHTGHSESPPAHLSSMELNP